MKTADFNYHLPKELIAQTPLEERDASRLMVLHRNQNLIEHRRFTDLTEYFNRGDLAVFNNSRVMPARLRGQKEGGAANVEILLLKQLESDIWQVLLKPARRLPVGSMVRLVAFKESLNRESDAFTFAQILSKDDDGVSVVRFRNPQVLNQLGSIPLPPYITTPLDDPERYQTIYADQVGSVAAPTAGLHFTSRLIQQMREKGVQIVFVNLAISLDTFRAVKVDDPLLHRIHKEKYCISEEAARNINLAKREGRSVFCVGTSAARALEQSALLHDGSVYAESAEASLLILPGHRWQVVDHLITNFHLPKSTLLMLVSSFYQREKILEAYSQAVESRYRFFSFGDSMLIL